ncbi:protein CpxP [Pedobacter sp. UYEF25]
MKRLILILFAVILLGLTTQAQQKMPTPAETAKKNVDDLTTRLKLNDTQKSVIYRFTYAQAKEQSEMIKRQQAGTPKDDDADKYYKIQNETNANIRDVLKGDQKTEFDKVIEERLRGITPDSKKRKKGKEPEVEGDIRGLLIKPDSVKNNHQ